MLEMKLIRKKQEAEKKKKEEADKIERAKILKQKEEAYK